MRSTNEVISLVNAADTAVRTACVLHLLKDSLPLPPFADEAVEGAIAMLDDALKGSALLTGQADIQGFSGNLDALCWATDSYIAERAGGSTHPDPSDVEKLLRQVHEQMKQVHVRIKEQSCNGAAGVCFDEAKSFFGTLAKMLAQRATASLTRPTRAYAAAGIP